MSVALMKCYSNDKESCPKNRGHCRLCGRCQNEPYHGGTHNTRGLTCDVCDPDGQEIMYKDPEE